jgi:hypothetical protein
LGARHEIASRTAWYPTMTSVQARRLHSGGQRLAVCVTDGRINFTVGNRTTKM